MLLEVKNVNTYYGSIRALKDVSLAVDQGEIVTVIGANGAGKTTLLNTISGLLHASEGELLLDTQSITRLSPDKIVRLGISQVPERRQVFSTLNVLDNLLLGAYVRHGRETKATIQKDLDFVFEVFPILKGRRKQMGGTLSGGEQQMLAIGRALMAQPKVLLLDEPLMGLSPLMQATLIRATKEIRDEMKISIIVTEQYARPVLPIVDYAFILENGAAVMEGTREELMDNPDVRAAYFGV